MWSFPRSPAGWRPRLVLAPGRTSSAVLALAGLAASAVLALGCAHYSQPAAETEQWAASVRETAGQAAELTAQGARKTGRAVATAVHGVRKGFDEPDPVAYGPFPEGYARRIQSHMRHFGGASESASFQFGKPGRGYLNAGLLAGGGVAWQGWLVELTVQEESLFASQARPRSFVVRMRDGEVVEVLEAAYADGLRWADGGREGRPGEGVAANME